MATPLDGLDRYLLITSDSHAGPSPEGYEPYLEKRWHADFQDWLKQSAEVAKMMRQVMGDRSIGVDGDPDIVGDRNWDNARRTRETEADGVVAVFCLLPKRIFDSRSNWARRRARPGRCD